MKIAVLAGGFSGERNISLKSGKAVANGLIEAGFDVVTLDPALGENSKIDLLNLELSNQEPNLDELNKENYSNFTKFINTKELDNVDCVFNLVHGKWGEDGHLSSLLDFRGLKYVGSNFPSSALAMDKIRTKMIFSAAGISTPEWITIRANEIDDLNYEEIRADLGREIVVKPSDQGSALGMSIIRNGNLDEIEKGIRFAAKYSNRILVERYIRGRELTIGILGNEVLPIVEIIPHEGFYDYTNKYTKGKTEYICPADLLEDIAEFTSNMAETAHAVLGCKDYSRIDFRLSEDNIPYCLEVNTIPGFTELSLYPMAAKAYGLNFTELVKRLVEQASK